MIGECAAGWRPHPSLLISFVDSPSIRGMALYPRWVSASDAVAKKNTDLVLNSLSGVLCWNCETSSHPLTGMSPTLREGVHNMQGIVEI